MCTARPVLCVSAAIVAVLTGLGCNAPDRAAERPDAAPKSNVVSPSLHGYDVVCIVVDSLRADRVGSGFAPAIDRVAGEGLVFESAAANSSATVQSLAALFTGLLPTTGGTIGLYEAEPHDKTATLAQHFEQAGYYTGVLANQPEIVGRGFTKGFADIQIASPNSPWTDEDLVRRASEFLEDAGDDRIFLYLHFAGPATVLRKANAPESATPPATELTAEYDAAVAAVDKQIGQVIEELEESGRADSTLLVLTSLHGAELLDHGDTGAGWTLYEEVIRVPLILHAPKALPAATVSERVGLVDVPATLLTLLGLDNNDAYTDSRSWFAADGEGFRYAPDPRPEISELVIPERCIVRSVTDGGWKYVAGSLWPVVAERDAVAAAHEETANAYLDGTKTPPPLWGAEAFEALFNLGEDPGETTNQMHQSPDVLDRLRAALADYRAACAEHALPPRMATRFQETLRPEDVANLESLGYL